VPLNRGHDGGSWPVADMTAACRGGGFLGWNCRARTCIAIAAQIKVGITEAWNSDEPRSACPARALPAPFLGVMDDEHGVTPSVCGNQADCGGFVAFVKMRARTRSFRLRKQTAVGPTTFC
jgi:hypothetical protein